MMEERVRVVALEERYALVRAASPAGGCGTCAMQRGCGVGALGRLLRREGRTWRVANTVAAQVGDEITVGVPDAALLTAAVLAYLLPLLTMLVGAAVAGATATGDTEVALGAGLGLIAGFALARWLGGRVARRLTPRITGRR